jgi:outer membrane receptor protein involved in Fe transport
MSDSYRKTSNSSFDLLYAGTMDNNIFSWKIRYYHFLDKYTSYDDRDSAPSSQTEITSDGFQAQISFENQLFSVTTGLDYQKVDFSRYSNISDPATIIGDIANVGAYVNAKARLLDDNLIVTAGFRYDQNNNNATGLSKKVNNASSSVGIAYLPIDILKFRANYSKGFRMPTVSELAIDYDMIFYYYGQFSYYHYPANPNLKPEHTKTLEFGFDLSTDFFFNLSVTYFLTDYKDQILSQLVRISDDYSEYWYNHINAPTETNAAGIEVAANFDIGAYFDLPVSLTPYFNATFYTRRHGVYGEHPVLVRVPKTVYSYGLSFDYPEYTISASINAYYRGSIYETNGIKRPGYTTVNLFVQKQLFEFIDQHKLSVQASVKNLFNKFYDPMPGYMIPGRSFYVALRYDFN